MSEESEDEVRKLRHALRNAEQQQLALKSVIGKAAQELDDLAEADCDTEAKEKAAKTADRLREIKKM